MNKSKLVNAFSGRYGFESLYYHGDHVRDYGSTIEAGVDLPWYWRMSRFISNFAERLYWLRKILSLEFGWCRYDDDYGMGTNRGTPARRWFFKKTPKRAFYTFKCLLCLILCSRRSAPDRLYDFVEVAVFDFHVLGGEYGGEGWHSVAVGYGVFANWYFREYSDSSC